MRRQAYPVSRMRPNSRYRGLFERDTGNSGQDIQSLFPAPCSGRNRGAPRTGCGTTLRIRMQLKANPASLKVGRSTQPKPSMAAFRSRLVVAPLASHSRSVGDTLPEVMGNARLRRLVSGACRVLFEPVPETGLVMAVLSGLLLHRRPPGHRPVDRGTVRPLPSHMHDAHYGFRT